MATIDDHNGASSPTQPGASLREDAPLRADASDSGGGCCSGVRFIAGCFGALSVGVSIALLAQVLAGAGGEGGGAAQHGAVAADAARCSRSGTAVLQNGGSVFDAAAAAAFCLVVMAPHRASVDASGALMLWEYRELKRGRPLLARWGPNDSNVSESGGKPPRLVAALAAMHVRWGSAPWPNLLQPAIDIASSGFIVSEDLAAAFALKPNGVPEVSGGARAGDTLRLPELAQYLKQLQLNTSAEWSKLWDGGLEMSEMSPSTPAAGWALYADDGVVNALADLLRQDAQDPRPERRLLHAVEACRSLPGVEAGTGVAAVGGRDVYVSLGLGLAEWFGPAGGRAPQPALFAEDAVCGRRYVLGASDPRALTQVLAALARGEGPPDAGAELQAAIESARALPAGPSVVWSDSGAGASPSAAEHAALSAGGRVLPAPAPRHTVNVVSQLGDALASHSDSRARGVASRF